MAEIFHLFSIRKCTYHINGAITKRCMEFPMIRHPKITLKLTNWDHKNVEHFIILAKFTWIFNQKPCGWICFAIVSTVLIVLIPSNWDGREATPCFTVQVARKLLVQDSNKYYVSRVLEFFFPKNSRTLKHYIMSPTKWATGRALKLHMWMVTKFLIGILNFLIKGTHKILQKLKGTAIWINFVSIFISAICINSTANYAWIRQWK